MRFSELRFQKYGLLSDRVIELPRGASDLHVLAGPNEAGKSMMRVGIEDWLYGFRPRSRMAIGYQAALLRVGGSLRGDPPFSSVRKKGNKDTLLGLDDQPVSDAPLLAALGSCPTRDQFQQQHCLHHAALRAGGAALAGISSDDQASSLIFETTSGVAGLADLVAVFEERSARYFTKRKGRDVAFYQAKSRFDQALDTLGEVRVMESRFAALKRNKRRADEASEALERQKQDLMRHAARINRVLQLAHQVDAYQCAIAELESLDNPAPMPPEKIAEAIEAGQMLAQVRNERETLAERELTARKAVEGFTLDAALAEAEDDIEQIASATGHVFQAMKDLPVQQALADDGLDHLRRLGRNLDWGLKLSGDLAELDAIRNKLPPNNLRAATGKILQGMREARAKLDTATQTHVDRQSDLQAAEDRLKKIAPAADVGARQALLQRARDHIAAAPDARQLDRLRGKMQRIADALDGWEHPAAALLKLKLPSQDEVSRAHCALIDAEADERDAGRACTEMARAIEAASARRDEAERVRDAPPSRQALDQARDARSTLWSALRSGAKVIETDGDEYEARVADADRIADQRYDSAQVAHRIDAARDDLASRRHELDNLRKTRDDCAGTVARHKADWAKRLASIGMPYQQGPDMEAWRTQIATCREYQNEIDELQAQLKIYGDRSERLEEALRAALGDAETAGTLDTLTDALEGQLTQSAADQVRRTEATGALEKARDALGRATTAQRAARAQFDEQCSRWINQLVQLGLPPEMDEHVAERTVEAMAEIDQRQHVTRTALSRAGEMIATITQFEARVASLATPLGIDTQADAIATARLLDRRLREHRERRAKLEILQAQQSRAQADLDASQQALQRAQSTMAGLKTLFSVDDEAALAQAAKRHQQASELREQRDAARRAVVRGAGAIPFEQVVEEVHAANREALFPDLQRIEAELEALQEPLNQATIERADCQRQLAEVDGSERAAVAESERVAALADMEESVTNCVQNKASAIILAWAVRKHRKRSQSPLLHRASEFFAELTEHRYEGFDIDDSGARPVLKAVPSGSQNWLDHDMLSDGTLDVMYLALRLAALDLSAQQRPIPPLIADDLFINLDEARARCGLKLLQRLSENFQVIFLTHQLGLVDVAREACPDVDIQQMDRLALC